MEPLRQTALVTGPTSGIGHGVACILAERGFDLFLVSRNGEKLAAVKNDLESHHGIAVSTMGQDLSQPGAAKRVFDEAQARGIDISILVNNAGFGIGGELTDMEPRVVAQMIQLNIITPTELCLLFGREMKRKRSGRILNLSSTAAYQPTPYIAAYGGTKSYILNFSEALAKEMEDYGVVATCLVPGPTDTSFFDRTGIEGLDEKQTGLWAKKKRMSPRSVARIGVDALAAGKLTTIAGLRNFLLAFANRLVPRSLSATISKWMIKQASGI